MPEAAETGNRKEAPETAAETEKAGAETDTHQDGPGDVNHECPPACDTAHGEQP